MIFPLLLPINRTFLASKNLQLGLKLKYFGEIISLNN